MSMEWISWQLKRGRFLLQDSRRPFKTWSLFKMLNTSGQWPACDYPVHINQLGVETNLFMGLPKLDCVYPFKSAGHIDDHDA